MLKVDSSVPNWSSPIKLKQQNYKLPIFILVFCNYLPAFNKFWASACADATSTIVFSLRCPCKNNNCTALFYYKKQNFNAIEII